MCAYNENSLMLTRIYPYATRENHIHSRNALHCVTMKQRSSLREPFGTTGEGEGLSPTSDPGPTGEG